MKLEGYEYIISNITPGYWYEEGSPKERYFLDNQNLDYITHKKQGDNDCRWWIISPCKPIGINLTKENSKELIKWCVERCYLDTETTDHEFYEWDFKNHCIKN